MRFKYAADRAAVKDERVKWNFRKAPPHAVEHAQQPDDFRDDAGFLCNLF